MSSSSDSDIQLVRDWVEQVWNQADFAQIARFHPSVFENEGKFASREAVQQWHLQMRTTYPDLQYVIDDIFATDGQVALRWTANATQQGNLWGLIPPTNKQVSWTGMHMLRIEAGQIVQVWAVANTVSVLQQLGVTLQPPQ